MEKSNLSDICCIYEMLRNDSIKKKFYAALNYGNKSVVLLIDVGPIMLRLLQTNLTTLTLKLRCVVFLWTSNNKTPISERFR